MITLVGGWMRERAANCQVSETLEEAWGWGFCNLCHLNKTISSFSIDLIGPQFVIYHWLTGPLNFSPKCGFEAWAFILFCTRNIQRCHSNGNDFASPINTQKEVFPFEKQML
jgi:hypothetical protein